MPLLSEIARSGALNYERARRGWLEYPEERQARTLKDLEIQSKQQEISYHPIKQRMKQEKAAREVKKQELFVRNANQVYKKAVEENRTDQLENFSKVMSETFIAGSRELKSGETRAQVARAALLANKDRILEEGDPEDDKKFMQTLAIKNDETFMQTYNSIKELNPHIQKLIQDEKEITRIEQGVPGEFAGITKAQAGKIVTGDIEGEVDLYSGIKGIEEIKKFVTSPDFVGGIAGDAVSMINSAAVQVSQLFGGGQIIRDGKLDESQLAIKDKGIIARLKRAAITGDRREAAIIELAYIKARSMGNIRITDKDYSYAERTFGRGANVESILKVLEDNQSRMISRFNTKRSILNKRLKKNLPQISREDILGAPLDPASPKGMADKLLRDAGIR